MTRKDYRLIAETIKRVKEHYTEPKEHAEAIQATLEVLAGELAEELHKASGYTPNGNKSFRDDIFLEACGFNQVN